jgi:hypothetical protein
MCLLSCSDKAGNFHTCRRNFRVNWADKQRERVNSLLSTASTTRQMRAGKEESINFSVHADRAGQVNSLVVGFA